ncbi:unnamed protein product, partial [Phaeothamnion confervicola]
LQVKVELVGASVVAVMTPQEARWPPYRIDNLTSHRIRFRQS